MFVDEGFFDFVNNNEDNTKNMNYDDNNITTTTTANKKEIAPCEDMPQGSLFKN